MSKGSRVVQEVPAKEAGRARLSAPRSGRLEGRRRAKAIERVRTRLEKLQRRVANGHLKVAERIGHLAPTRRPRDIRRHAPADRLLGSWSEPAG
jgi:hypothetical protein